MAIEGSFCRKAAQLGIEADDRLPPVGRLFAAYRMLLVTAGHLDQALKKAARHLRGVTLPKVVRPTQPTWGCRDNQPQIDSRTPPYERCPICQAGLGDGP